MLDLRTIARDPGPVREALARRRDGSDERLDQALALRERRNVLTHEWETERARQKEASEAIGRAKKAGEDASAAIAEMQTVAARVKEMGEELSSSEAELDAIVATLPNPPDPSAASEDTVLSDWGSPAPRSPARASRT